MRQRKVKVANQRKRMARVSAKTKTRKKAVHTKASVSKRNGMTRANADSQLVRRQGQRHASYVKEASVSLTPVFLPCALVGPDGRERPGWEMRVGEIMFGRADS